MGLLETKAIPQIRPNEVVGLDIQELSTSIDIVERYRDLLRPTVHELVLNNPNRAPSASARLVLDVDGVVLGKVTQRSELLRRRDRQIRKAQRLPEESRLSYQHKLAKLTYHDEIDYTELLRQNPEYRSLRQLLREHPELRDDRELYEYYDKKISPRSALYGILPPELTSVDGNGWMVPGTLKRLREELGVEIGLWCTGTLNRFTPLMQQRLEEFGTPKGIPIIGRVVDVPHEDIPIWRAAVASLVAERFPHELVFAVDNVIDMSRYVNAFRETGYLPFSKVIGLHYTVDQEDEYSVNWGNALEAIGRFINRD